MHLTRRLAFTAALLAPLAAFAHPGHDGDHDITWDFGHLVNHPLATLACLSVGAVASWILWRQIRKPTETKAERVKRDVSRTR